MEKPKDFAFLTLIVIFKGDISHSFESYFCFVDITICYKLLSIK